MSEVKQMPELIGVTVNRISGMTEGSEQILLHLEDGRTATFWHNQDCCESVSVKDVCGDIADLIGSPLVRAEERTSASETVDWSQTWTFYEFATVKGSVTVQWLGESNGYYSEDVSWRITP